jgi:peptide chain release factor subunit 3
MYAMPGENVRLKLKNAEEEDLNKGGMLCDVDDVCYLAEGIEVRIKVLELPDHKNIMSSGYTCVLHMHAAVEEVEVRRVISRFNPDKELNEASTFLKSGDTGLLRLKVL